MLCKEMSVADKIEIILKQNEGIDLSSCYCDHFSAYGSILNGYSEEEFKIVFDLQYESNGGVSYIPGIEELEKCSAVKDIQGAVFGELPVQAGWCRGYNTEVMALEYHKSSEVIVAVTDLILFLGDGRQMKDGKYHYNDVRGYFVPSGTALELYAYTLHFAPLQADKDEFVSIIILPKETNLPLDDFGCELESHENSMLYAKNKWLVAHKNSKQAAAGAHVGIIGQEISLIL